MKETYAELMQLFSSVRVLLEFRHLKNIFQAKAEYKAQ